MSGLVELARRYVALNDELEAVRGEIKRVVLNGAGDAATSLDEALERRRGGKPEQRVVVQYIRGGGNQVVGMVSKRGWLGLTPNNPP
jgi:hypothetical protein